VGGEGVIRHLEEFIAQRLWYQARQEADRLLRLPRTCLTEAEYLTVLLSGGKTRYGEGDFVGAIAFFERALRQAFTLRAIESVATCRVALGAAYVQTAELPQAYEHLMAYLADLPRFRDGAKWEGHVRYNLGLICRRTGRPAEGIEHYLAAVDFFVQRGFYRDAGDSQQNLVWLYLLEENAEAALPHLECAESYAHHLEPEYRAEMLCCWARYYLVANQPDIATAYSEEVLVGHTPGVLPRHKSMAAVIAGDIAFSMEDFAQAQLLARHAIKFAEEARRDPELIRMALQLWERIEQDASGQGKAAN
jgi:tetratricopeptide (TPR) repeat protein